MKIHKLLPFIGIILFLYIIYDIGIGKLFNSVSSIPFIYILGASVFIIPSVFVGALKWWYICRLQNMDIQLSYIIKIFLICMFYGIITPASIGSMVSIYYIREKTNDSWEKCTTNSLLDVSTDFLTLLFLGFLGSFFFFEFFTGIVYTLSVLFLFFSIAFFILMKKQRMSWLFRFIFQPLLPQKIKNIIGNSMELLYEDIPGISNMIVPFLLGLIFWMFHGIQVYIIAQAFSITIPIYIFILVFPISILAGLLPISIGGLGVREGAFVVMLSYFGVQPDIAVVLSLCSFFLSTIIPGITGWLFSIHTHYTA